MIQLWNNIRHVLCKAICLYVYHHEDGNLGSSGVYAQSFDLESEYFDMKSALNLLKDSIIPGMSFSDGKIVVRTWKVLFAISFTESVICKT